MDIYLDNSATTKLDEEELMMEALEAGADNFESDDEFYEITTAPQDFSKVREYLEEKGIEPLAYKLFCFNSHYRNKLNFTFEGALSSQKALTRLREGYIKNLEGNDDIEDEKIAEYEKRFHEAINDDLNIPSAMSIVWEIIRCDAKSKKLSNLLEKFDEVLGLDLVNSKKYLEKQIEVPEDILNMLKERNKAKQEKNYTLADSLRDKIKEKGYIIKDTTDGAKLEKI